MSLYKRGEIWWYKFKFAGVLIRESTGLTSWSQARDVEDKRRLELKEGRAGVVRANRPGMFSVAASAYLSGKKDEWAPKTHVIESTNNGHLESFFGNNLLSDISPLLVGAYRDKRLKQKAAHKTIALEIGTLRGILLYHDMDAQWRAIRKKIKLMKAKKIGTVLTLEEESALLRECRASRSRSLPVAFSLALQTCMRLSELRLLQWRQIDTTRGTITVGQSKTAAGTGRQIPLTTAAKLSVEFWAGQFPARKPNHFVFPQEQYGAGTNDFTPCTYDTDPTKPIGSWKEAWEGAKERAGVECRWHDLRHTGCTRLLESGVSHPIVAEIMGWSSSTAIRMIREVYGHISLDARRGAMEQMEKHIEQQKGAQKVAQSKEAENVVYQ
jgi:integrase